MFNRRHYETIARVFEEERKRQYEDAPGFRDTRCDAIAEVATALADVFGRDNPNFNRVRFLQACDCEDKGA